MLAELAIANAAFAVIKQTLSNGRELADAGKAVGAVSYTHLTLPTTPYV